MRSIKLDNSVLSILEYGHWQIRINTIIYNIRYKGNDKNRINKIYGRKFTEMLYFGF